MGVFLPLPTLFATPFATASSSLDLDDDQAVDASMQSTIRSHSQPKLPTTARSFGHPRIPRRCSEAQGYGSDRLIALEPSLCVEFFEVAQVEDQRRPAHNGCIVKHWTDGIAAALEGTEDGSGPGVRRQLTIVVAGDAQHQAFANFATDGPFEVKLGAG